MLKEGGILKSISGIVGDDFVSVDAEDLIAYQKSCPVTAIPASC